MARRRPGSSRNTTTMTRVQRPEHHSNIRRAQALHPCRHSLWAIQVPPTSPPRPRLCSRSQAAAKMLQQPTSPDRRRRRQARGRRSRSDATALQNQTLRQPRRRRPGAPYPRTRPTRIPPTTFPHLSHRMSGRPVSRPQHRRPRCEAQQQACPPRAPCPQPRTAAPSAPLPSPRLRSRASTGNPAARQRRLTRSTSRCSVSRLPLLPFAPHTSEMSVSSSCGPCSFAEGGRRNRAARARCAAGQVQCKALRELIEMSITSQWAGRHVRPLVDGLFGHACNGGVATLKPQWMHSEEIVWSP